MPLQLDQGRVMKTEKGGETPNEVSDSDQQDSDGQVVYQGGLILNFQVQRDLASTVI